MPRRSAAADTCIGSGRGLGVLVPKLLSDGFEGAGLGIEHHLGAQVPELMRREDDAGTPLQAARDQIGDSLLALRRSFDSHEQPCRAVADDLRCDAITILDQHLGYAGRMSKASSSRFFISAADNSSVEMAPGPSWMNK